MDNTTTPEAQKADAKKTARKTLAGRIFGGVMGIVAVAGLHTATAPTASAAITNTTFEPIVNMIDAIIPLFTSLLDLIIAAMPLLLIMAFFGGLAYFITQIFSGTLDINKFMGKGRR